jgi:hypothetical protein
MNFSRQWSAGEESPVGGMESGWDDETTGTKERAGVVEVSSSSARTCRACRSSDGTM